jgi:hypothetical protein
LETAAVKALSEIQVMAPAIMGVFTPRKSLPCFHSASNRFMVDPLLDGRAGPIQVPTYYIFLFML